MRNLRLPIYPFLLGIYPALFVYAYNKQHFTISVIWLPIVVALLSVLLAFALFLAILKSPHKAAFMAGMCCVTVILYNPLNQWLHNIRIETPLFVVGPTKVIFAFILLFLLFSFNLLIRTKSSLPNLTKIMNVVAIALVSMPIIIILSYRLLPNRIRSSTDGPQEGLTFDQAITGSDTLPDIYHFVMDGYARWDIYKDYYNFHNDKLRDFFVDNGFLISDTSRSNYAQTALTFASMLNGNYLQKMLENLDASADTDDRTPIYRLTRKNAVFSTLKKAGYQIQVFESGYEGTEFRGAPVTNLGPNTGRIRDLDFLDEFQSELLDLTPFPAVLRLFGHGDLRGPSVKRARINYAFDNVGKVWPEHDESGSASMPVYNLVHILGPHYPHLYKSDGTPFDATEGRTGDACRIIGKGGISAMTYVERHVNYVNYLNGRLMEAIERILESQRRKTVILVSSDHGPRSNCDASNLLNPSYLRERTANLLAIYAPDMENRTLFSNTTPVNYYRIIFNEYLGADLPLLPDNVYYSSFNNPYAFFDITESTAPDN